MDEKISIIIPVYNVEDYLRECIDSVICQTYRNLEILLIDDGSTDRSPEICDSYAANDERIFVFHEKNAGASEARNAGLAHASGNYILFLDSDDWLLKQACEMLLREMENAQADCVVGSCVHVVEEDGRLVEKRQNFSGRAENREPKEAVKQVLMGTSAVWNRLFRRELFADVRFTPGRINEDEYVALQVYAKCERIVFLDRLTYYYRERVGSVTKSVTNDAFSVRNVDYFYNAEDILQWTKEQFPEMLPAAERKWLRRMLYCYVGLRKVPEGAALRRRFHGMLKENRRTALSSRCLEFPIKCAIVLLGTLPAW